MITLFNSLSKKKEKFRPQVKGKVTMYHCGPTVYDYVHIGNLRSFLFADLLRRFFDTEGYDVTQIMNITDVGHMLADADEGEDKVVTAAKKIGKTPQEVALFYTDAFFRDINRLGIRPAHAYPKASEHVREMITMIEKLIANGYAYQVNNNVYFDVGSFDAYGKLSGNKIEDLEAGARIAVRNEKKHAADFALWIHNPKHLMQWESPWGNGYPGWHIECSAMAQKYLGETIDIHTGGEDNKFPHHECEIAQSEGASGETFVRYWLHVTHLFVESEKMSKSKGNFYTLDDLLAKGFSARAIRYALLSVHYRQSLNFTFVGLEGAVNSLSRIDAYADALIDASPSVLGKKDNESARAQKMFRAALSDDMNISSALAIVFEEVRRGNELIANHELTKKQQEGSIAFLETVGNVLGFTFGSLADEKDVPASVLSLIEKRDEARGAKRFQEADRLRDEIKEKGYIVEDTPDGRRVKRV